MRVEPEYYPAVREFIREAAAVHSWPGAASAREEFGRDSSARCAGIPREARRCSCGNCVKEICHRGNNNIVIIIFLVHDNVYIPC
jgi:hypothetical protein